MHANLIGGDRRNEADRATHHSRFVALFESFPSLNLKLLPCGDPRALSTRSNLLTSIPPGRQLLDQMLFFLLIAAFGPCVPL